MKIGTEGQGIRPMDPEKKLTPEEIEFNKKLDAERDRMNKEMGEYLSSVSTPEQVERQLEAVREQKEFGKMSKKSQEPGSGTIRPSL